MPIKRRLSFPSPKHGAMTLLISSYEVPISRLEPSRITRTTSIKSFPFSSFLVKRSIMPFECCLSSSTPSPKPGLSQRVRFPSSYFAICIVSGVEPVPTFAFSALKSAFIVELFPQPVARIKAISAVFADEQHLIAHSLRKKAARFCREHKRSPNKNATGKTTNGWDSNLYFAL